MLKISFCTPLLFHSTTLSTTLCESIPEKISRYIESYFTPFSKGKAVQVFGYRTEKLVYPCILVDNPTPKWKTVVKVASYFLVFTIIIALIIKLILRIVICKKYGECRVENSEIFLPKFSPEERLGMQNLHKEAHSLLNKYPKGIPDDEQEKLGIKVLSKRYSFSKDSTNLLTYTSEKYPKYVFKSGMPAAVSYRYASGLIADLVVRNNQLNLIHIPKFRIEESLVPGWGLMVTERVEGLEWTDSSGVPFGPDRVGAMKQFVTFVKETFFFGNFWSNVPYMKSKEGEQHRKLVLYRTCGLFFTDYSKDVSALESHFRNCWNLFPHDEECFIAVCKALYEACPTEQVRAFLEKESRLRSLVLDLG